jgi:hypothetical protein
MRKENDAYPTTSALRTKLEDLVKLLYWNTMMPAIVTQMMPFVGRSIQAMAAAARAALSRDEMVVGTLSCELSLVPA